MNNTTRFLDSLTHEQLLSRLELALRGANLGIWDWDLRDNSVQFDQRWCAMLGLDHDATAMVLATWADRVHPDDLARTYADINAHIEGRTEYYENVHRMRHANGEWVHILDRGRISGRDEQGRPIRFTGTHFDLTSRERDRQRLAAHERELADLVATFPSAIALFDRDLRYLAASDLWLAMFGVRTPVRGVHLGDALVPDIAAWAAVLQRVLAGEELYRDEEVWQDPATGTERWRRWVAKPWRRGGGKPEGAIVRVDDVTELVLARRAREQQRDARMQMLALFAGGVAHEINSPLQVIGIEAHLIAAALERGEANLDELHKSARSIVEMAQRAMAITRALRTLSRDPHGDPPENVPIAGMFEQVSALVAARLRAVDVRLELRCVESGLAVRSRPAELLHVLVNLVDNAHYAALEGERWVRLSAERDGEQVVLRCVDGGNGVAPDKLAMLGTPFFTTKPSGQGTGLGLSIVRVLVERSGGTFRHVPDARHTTFEVRLPSGAGDGPTDREVGA